MIFSNQKRHLERNYTMAKITDEFKKTWKFETQQLHIGQEDYDHTTDARAVPIYQTSSFAMRSTQRIVLR